MVEVYRPQTRDAGPPLSKQDGGFRGVALGSWGSAPPPR